MIGSTQEHLPFPLEIGPEAFTTPIPNLDADRGLRRAGYAALETDVLHPLYTDPVVPLGSYGVASRSYYSRPNVTGDPIPGVRPDVIVRRDVAERLALVNYVLRNADFIRERFGGVPLELFVDDGIRSVDLQRHVYEERYPDFLRTLHGPDSDDPWTEEQILAERDRRVAKPSSSSPHAAGAIDVKFINAETGAVDERFSNGVVHGRKLTLQPDYYEANPDEAGENVIAVRRLLWAIMRAAGFWHNPEEIWHYGTGDKLSALMGGHRPYYDAVAGTPEREVRESIVEERPWDFTTYKVPDMATAVGDYDSLENSILDGLGRDFVEARSDHAADRV